MYYYKYYTIIQYLFNNISVGFSLFQGHLSLSLLLICPFLVFLSENGQTENYFFCFSPQHLAQKLSFSDNCIY